MKPLVSWFLDVFRNYRKSVVWDELTLPVPIPEKKKKITQIFISIQLSGMHRAGRIKITKKIYFCNGNSYCDCLHFPLQWIKFHPSTVLLWKIKIKITPQILRDKDFTRIECNGFVINKLQILAVHELQFLILAYVSCIYSGWKIFFSLWIYSFCNSSYIGFIYAASVFKFR